MEYHIGQIITGCVSGIQPYGAFISIDGKVSGLIHISELSEGFVKDVHHFVKVNDYVQVKIIDIDPTTQQYRLSLKAVATSTSRKERKNRHFNRLPIMKIGFQSIKENLDQWVSDAMEGKHD